MEGGDRLPTEGDLFAGLSVAVGDVGGGAVPIVQMMLMFLHRCLCFCPRFCGRCYPARSVDSCVRATDDDILCGMIMVMTTMMLVLALALVEGSNYSTRHVFLLSFSRCGYFGGGTVPSHSLRL